MRQLDALVFTEQARKRSVASLSTDKTMLHPAYVTLKSTDVTPAGTWLDVSIRGFGFGAGEAFVRNYITYGVADGAGRLRDAGQYGPLIAGATNLELGSSGYITGNHRIYDKVTLTGLTPGVQIRINWEIVIGGGMYTTVGNLINPQFIRILPDGKKLYISEGTNNTVQVIDAISQPTNYWIGFADVFRRRVTVGALPAGMACSPDSARVAVGNYNGPSVSIIETANDTVERTITTASAPLGIIWLDNTYVYACCANGHLYKINALTGAIPNDITVGTNHLCHPALNAAKTYLYIPGLTDKIYRMDTSSHAVTSFSGTFTGGSTFCQVGSDGNVYWSGGGAAASSIHITDAALGYITNKAPLQGGNAAIMDMVVSTDREWIYAVWADGCFGYFNIPATDYPGVNYFDAPDMGGSAQSIALNPQEGIYILMENGSTATNALFMFCGYAADFKAATIGILGEERAEIIVEGVA